MTTAADTLLRPMAILLTANDPETGDLDWNIVDRAHEAASQIYGTARHVPDIDQEVAPGEVLIDEETGLRFWFRPYPDFETEGEMAGRLLRNAAHLIATHANGNGDADIDDIAIIVEAASQDFAELGVDAETLRAVDLIAEGLCGRLSVDAARLIDAPQLASPAI